MCVAMLPGRQHALVHQLHLAHVVVRVGHEAEAVMNKQQETWVEMGVIDRAGGGDNHTTLITPTKTHAPNTVRTVKLSQALDSLDEHARPAARGWASKAVLGAQHLLGLGLALRLGLAL